MGNYINSAGLGTRLQGVMGVHVRYFGAKLDGVTEDGPAFQEAVDWVGHPDAGGPICFDGIAKISQRIMMKPASSVYGVGGNQNLDFPTNCGIDATDLALHGGADGIEYTALFQGSGSGGGTPTSNDNHYENFFIIGPNPAGQPSAAAGTWTGTTAIEPGYSAFKPVIRNVWVRDFDHGLYLYNTLYATIENNICKRNRVHAVAIRNAVFMKSTGNVWSDSDHDITNACCLFAVGCVSCVFEDQVDEALSGVKHACIILGGKDSVLQNHTIYNGAETCILMDEAATRWKLVNLIVGPFGYTANPNVAAVWIKPGVIDTVLDMGTFALAANQMYTIKDEGTRTVFRRISHQFSEYETGVVAHWPLNDAASAPATATIGGHHATQTGGVGAAGGKRTFNGTTQYLSAPHSGELSPVGGSFAVSLFFTLTALTGTQVIAAKDDGAGNREWRLSYVGGTGLLLETFGGTTATLNAGAVVAGTEYFVTAGRDAASGQLKLLLLAPTSNIEDVAILTEPDADGCGLPAAPAAFTIGALAGGGSPMGGSTREATLYNRWPGENQQAYHRRHHIGRILTG